MNTIQACQLSIAQKNEIKTSCAFTGHRILGEDFSARKLKKIVNQLVDGGVTTFYSGMAMGFDLIAAETVLAVKKKNAQVRLVACIPCYHQEKSFSEKDKKRYAQILKKADEQIVLSEHYYQGCMQQRNRYMVERADVLVAYCHDEKGGAAYTVKCFKKQKPHADILFI